MIRTQHHPVLQWALLLLLVFVASTKYANSFQDLTSPLARKFARLNATRPSSHHESLSEDCTQSQLSYSCHFCDEQFASRNGLFRHLRTNAECFSQASSATTTNEGHHQPIFLQLSKQKLAIRFGYHVKNHKNHNDVNDPISISIPISRTNQNEIAADLVKTSFFEALNSKQPVEPSGSESVTQSSVARHRHPCLSQDYDCSSSSDFICINFKGEPVQNMTLLRMDMQQRLDHYLSRSTITKNLTHHLEAIHLIDAR
jgi:hypothetical protein